jgi:hypothetical protein
MKIRILVYISWHKSEVQRLARKKRQWYPGATYHVMSRGNRRNAIFKEKYDCDAKSINLGVNYKYLIILVLDN